MGPGLVELYYRKTFPTQKESQTDSAAMVDEPNPSYK